MERYMDSNLSAEERAEDLKNTFFCEEDEQLLLDSARESMVLLKNDGTFPIQKNVKKIAVIGCHAGNAIRCLCDLWTDVKKRALWIVGPVEFVRIEKLVPGQKSIEG